MLRLLFAPCLAIVLWCIAYGDGHAQPIDRAIAAKNLATIEKFLQLPDDKIDYAQIKVAIDAMIAPDNFSPEAVHATLDRMANDIRAMYPQNATNWQKLESLQAYIYQEGAWNKGKVFRYDLGGDPKGNDITNKLLAKYLAKRRGNCVSMPILLVVLGQKIGLDISVATAPQHVFAKFRKDDGGWVNIEATNEAVMLPDELYIRTYEIPALPIKKGVYLRAHTKREVAVFLASLYLVHIDKLRDYKHMHALVDLMLPLAPTSPELLMVKANAYSAEIDARFVAKYQRPDNLPKHLKPEYDRLMGEYRKWSDKLDALGWTPMSPELSKKLDDLTEKEAQLRKKKGTL
jgi:regulator of sirC expression with transglutaminase-like and TPR domain